MGRPDNFANCWLSNVIFSLQYPGAEFLLVPHVSRHRRVRPSVIWKGSIMQRRFSLLLSTWSLAAARCRLEIRRPHGHPAARSSSPEPTVAPVAEATAPATIFRRLRPRNPRHEAPPVAMARWTTLRASPPLHPAPVTKWRWPRRSRHWRNLRGAHHPLDVKLGDVREVLVSDLANNTNYQVTASCATSAQWS